MADPRPTWRPGRYEPIASLEERRTWMAAWAMFLGLVSVLFFWLAPLSAPVAAVAILFGTLSLLQKRGAQGMAVAGIATGSIGMIGAAVVTALVLHFV